MKDHNNETIPSLERRLLTILQRKHLDELNEEAKKLEKKGFNKRDAYFTAEKSYQRFNEKYLGVVPEQEEKNKFIFPILTTKFAQNVATFVLVASLALIGTLSTQAIYNGGKVEIDNGKDSIVNFYIDDSISDVSYGGIEDYQRYDDFEEVEELKGKNILMLPGQSSSIVQIKQQVDNQQDSIEIYKINYLIDEESIWITMRVNDIYELKEEIVEVNNYNDLFELLHLNLIFQKDGISNLSFIYEEVRYDILIQGTKEELKDILQLLEVTNL